MEASVLTDLLVYVPKTLMEYYVNVVYQDENRKKMKKRTIDKYRCP